MHTPIDATKARSINRNVFMFLVMPPMKKERSVPRIIANKVISFINWYIGCLTIKLRGRL